MVSSCSSAWLETEVQSLSWVWPSSSSLTQLCGQTASKVAGVACPRSPRSCQRARLPLPAVQTSYLLWWGPTWTPILPLETWTTHRWANPPDDLGDLGDRTVPRSVVKTLDSVFWSSVSGDGGKSEGERRRRWHQAVLRAAQQLSGRHSKLGWKHPRLHGLLHWGPGAAPGICLCWALHPATGVQVGLLKFHCVKSSLSYLFSYWWKSP